MPMKLYVCGSYDKDQIYLCICYMYRPYDLFPFLSLPLSLLPSLPLPGVSLSLLNTQLACIDHLCI